jgi:hypothetical protein
MSAPKIITNYEPRGIQNHPFGWSAWVPGTDPNMVGMGRDEQGAIEDLKRLQAEEAEWQERPEGGREEDV